MPHTSHVTDCRPVIYGRRRRLPVLNLTLLPASTPHVVMAPRKVGVAPCTVWPFWLVRCKTGCVFRENNQIYLFCQQRICISVFWWTALHSELVLYGSHGSGGSERHCGENWRFQTFALWHSHYCHDMFTGEIFRIMTNCINVPATLMSTCTFTTNILILLILLLLSPHTTTATTSTNQW